MRNDVTIYYDILGADDCDGRTNPFKHMLELGISFLYVADGPLTKMKTFYGCYDVPHDLPDYMMVRDYNA